MVKWGELDPCAPMSMIMVLLATSKTITDRLCKRWSALNLWKASKLNKSRLAGRGGSRAGLWGAYSNSFFTLLFDIGNIAIWGARAPSPLDLPLHVGSGNIKNTRIEKNDMESWLPRDFKFDFLAILQFLL